jgi:DNA-3-methyladenine glycosylase II
MADQFELEPRGTFDLAASKRFIEGFAPAGQRTTEGGDLVLALLTDDWNAVTVRLRQSGMCVSGEVAAGACDGEVLRAQVERVLSLDVDGTGFAALGEHDLVLASLLMEYRGLRPVLFSTPFEAACWSVLTQRTRMSQAAAVRDRMVAANGVAMEVGGVTRHTFPAPRVVAALARVDGVSDQKVQRLRAVAHAALDGVLDPVALRHREVGQALTDVRTIPGIGPFGAELVLVRGAGAPDVFPTHERRLHQAMRRLYARSDASVEQLAGIAAGWRPYRSWVALLLRSWWEEHAGHALGLTTGC